MRRAMLFAIVLAVAAVGVFLLARPTGRDAGAPPATRRDDPAPVPPTLAAARNSSARAAFLPTSSPPAAAKGGVDLKGRVLSATTEMPIAAATVHVWIEGGNGDVVRKNASTDADGRFTVAGTSPDGSVLLVAEADGFGAERLERAGTAPRDDIVIRLEDGGFLEGSVRDAAGRPVAGVAVHLRGPVEPLPPRALGGQWLVWDGEIEAEQALLRTARTDEQGRYEIRGVPLRQPECAVVEITDRLEARSEPATLERPGQRARRDVAYPRPGSIHVRAAGTPRPSSSHVQVDVRGDTIWFTAEDADRRDDGTWLFEGLGSGGYEVQVFRSGLPPDSRRVQVKDGERAEVEFEAPKGLVLEGTVVDEAGNPVGRAGLIWDGPDPALTDCGADGRFRFEGLADGAGTLQVDPGPFARRVDPLARRSIEGVRPGGAPLRVVLHPAPRLVGRIPALGSGKRVGLQVLSRSVTSGSSVETTEGGAFERPVDEAGVACLLVLAVDGQAPYVLDIDPLTPGERRDVGDLRLDAGRALDGVVRDDSGAPLAGAKVIVAEKWFDLEARTAADGSFRFERLPPRRFEIRVDAPGFPVHIVEVPAGSGDLRRDVTVGRGGTLDLTVVDEAGKPVAGANVVFRPDGDYPYDVDFDKTRRHAETDGEGRLHARLQARGHHVTAYDSESRRRGEVARVEIRAGEATTLEIRVR